VGAFETAGLDRADVIAVLDRAAAEDLGTRGDVTSAATIPADALLTARYVSRGNGVVAGLVLLPVIVEHLLGGSASVQLLASDGDRVGPGDALAEIHGSAREILGVERLSLNLLGHLSGIATQTRCWVEAIDGMAAQIRDTRKTTPGLRDLEKYAVRCGGGVNHRRGLDDAVLIKDNHVAAAGGVGAALDAVTAAYPAGELAVQVEVDDLAQLDEAIDHCLASGHATSILLDNFSETDLLKAVERVRATAPGLLLESSGGLRIEDARRVAATGVDYLAVGALTHSAPVLDIGLDSVP
jgi:nicotinate-nucleotide pyrophosphorylase (carboxylating)